MKQKIKTIIFDHLLRPRGISNADDIEDNHNLHDDLSADSLDMVELCMAVEEEFEIDITDEQMQVWETVSDIYKTVEAR
jgi:acyl carrier protein